MSNKMIFGDESPEMCEAFGKALLSNVSAHFEKMWDTTLTGMLPDVMKPMMKLAFMGGYAASMSDQTCNMSSASEYLTKAIIPEAQGLTSEYVSKVQTMSKNQEGGGDSFSA